MSIQPKAADYSVIEHLRDGSAVEIRALRRTDRQEMMAAVEKISAESLHRRFFAPKRYFSEKELDFFLNVDFKTHVALVAVAELGGQSKIIGGGRYILVEPGKAEMAFAVIDACQGKGVGGLLLRHLIELARDDGIRELSAEVLPENAPMLKLFEKFGFRIARGKDPQIRHLVLQLA